MLSVVTACAQDFVTTETNRKKKLTVTISGYTAEPIKKVSGTNESFSVNVNITEVAYSPASQNWNLAYIESLKIYIGDELIKECSSNEFDPEDSYSFGVKWDTTHFTHGTTQNIKVEAKMKVRKGVFTVDPPPAPQNPVRHDFINPDDETIELNVPVSIYNYAGIAEVEEYSGTSGNSVYGKLFGTNHERDYRTDAYLSDFLGLLELSTVFDFNGHGDYFSVGAEQFNGHPEWWAYIDDITTARNIASSCGMPLINFAMLDCCYIGANNSFCQQFLIPYPQGLQGPHWTVDRCVTAWIIEVDDELLRCFTPKLFEHMATKDTVYIARRDAWDYQQRTLRTGSNPTYPGLITSYLNTWGDLQMRITGLYDGTDNEASSSWYLVTE